MFLLEAIIKIKFSLKYFIAFVALFAAIIAIALFNRRGIY